MPFNYPPWAFTLPHSTPEEKLYCKAFFATWDSLLEEQRIREGRLPLDETSNIIYSSRITPRIETGNRDNFRKIIKIYVYHHEYEDGPHLPAKFIVNDIYDETFKFYQYPRLVKLLDCRQCDIEVWNHNEGCWEPLDSVEGCESVENEFTGEFLIIRRADHPTGSNCNLIGLAELVRELDFLSGKKHLRTPLSPDDLCPPDVNCDLMEQAWCSLSEYLLYNPDTEERP